MTTIPGHNQIIQQSGPAQEISQQSQSPRPSPDQAAGIQQNQEVLENSTVLESDESERLKERNERERRRKMDEKRKKKKARQKSGEELAVDLDRTGRILDTTV